MYMYTYIYRPRGWGFASPTSPHGGALAFWTMAAVTGHETRDMGRDTGWDMGWDTLKSSLHWEWLSLGITFMAMFAAFPSTIMSSTTVGGGAGWKAANIATQVIPDESHPQ